MFLGLAPLHRHIAHCVHMILMSKVHVGHSSHHDNHDFYFLTRLHHVENQFFDTFGDIFTHEESIIVLKKYCLKNP